MTLNEAIEHAENVAETCNVLDCAKDHKQLSEWLKELREFIDKHYS